MQMDLALGIIKIRVRRGINLVARDVKTSDPYVVVSNGQQKVKTRVVKRSCNPVWDEELTLYVTNPYIPLKVNVYDKDTFSDDDRMGETEIDVKPLLECFRMGLEGLPNGTKVDRVQPSRYNCLSDESPIIWNNGKMTQDMVLRLRNVETGELVIQIELFDLPGSRSLSG